jgi:hypothetical protein
LLPGSSNIGGCSSEQRLLLWLLALLLLIWRPHRIHDSIQHVVHPCYKPLLHL